MLFQRIYDWIHPPEPPEKKRLWALTTNDKKYFIYTRDDHTEIMGLKSLKNGWYLLRSGVLGIDESEIFEVEKILNEFKDDSAETREKARSFLRKQYDHASPNSISRCAEVLVEASGHKTIDSLINEAIETLKGKNADR